jgi:hypothetical protein
MIECNMCGGPVKPLGKLGQTEYGRCRDCRATQEMEPEEEFDGDGEEQDHWIDG